MKCHCYSLLWSVAVIVLVLPTAAYPQIEEIVVTAQKREENLQDTPIAITAFTEEALEGRMINDISKLADFTPNVIFDTTAPISGLSNGAAVFIRGVGQLDFGLTTDPGVGTYIDGVYSSRAVGGVLDVVDIERIEILRGSQGTLFGRNTIGGAINITTKRPAREFGGMVEATFGEFERTDFKGSLDVPVTDRFGAKFAISSKNRNGFVDRIAVGDRLGDEDRQSARGSFLLEATDDIELYATVDYTNIDEQSAGSVMVGITEFPGEPSQGLAPSSTWAYNQVFVPANPGAAPYTLEKFLPGGKDQTLATGPTGTDLESFGATLTFTWSLPWVEFKSITSYRDTEGEFYRDPDNSSVEITETTNPNYNHEQFSQEVQLTGRGFNERLQYVLGAYYFEEDGTDDVFVPIYGALPTPVGLIALPLYINNYVTVDNDSKAVFGQGTFDVTEQIALTFGMRYTEDKKGFGYRQYISPDPFPGNIAVLALLGPPLATPGPADALVFWDEVSQKFDELNFRAGIEYQFNDDTLLYFTYADGYKSGGFNYRYVVPRLAPLPFDPETLESYEVGLKWQGLDDRLRINAAGFVSEYSDVQIQLFETGGGPLTQNAGVADIIGVELELTAAPHERLLLNAGFGYVDAEYDELNLPTTNVAQAVNLDTKLPNTPETTVNVSAQYSHPLSWGSLVVRGDYRYTDDLYNDAQNSPFLYQDGRSAELHPGDFALYDSTRPYTLHFDRPFRQIVLQIPYDSLAELFLRPENITARRVSARTAVGALTSQFIQSVAGRLDILSHQERGAINQHIIELIALAMSSMSSLREQNSRSIARTAMLERIKQYIEINIRHPQLTPAQVAKHHHISERYQRMLFASTGTTLSKYILNKRLELCREALENQALKDYSITQIAFSYGFNDAAHFSRKFKERYGASPKDYREKFISKGTA